MNHSHRLYVSAKSTLLLALVFTTGMSGCKPEPEGELGTPYDKVVGLYGTWELETVLQHDVCNDYLDPIELTTFYRDGITPSMKMTINENGDYSVTIERGRNFFGDQGTWEINNPEFPSFLNLRLTDVFGVEIDSMQANLGSIVRPHDNVMSLEFYTVLCNLDIDRCPDEAVLFTFNFIRN